MIRRINTLFIVLWITLWLAFVFPALAQEATPEATVEVIAQVDPAPDTEAAIPAVDPALVLELVKNAIILIAMFFIYRSVPPEALKEFAASFRELAKATPNRVDDFASGLLDTVAGSLPDSAPIIRPAVPTLPVQPEPTPGFEDKLNRIGGKFVEGPRLVEIPVGYEYVYTLGDVNGEHGVHFNINTNAQYDGARVNIDSAAAATGFKRVQAVVLKQDVLYHIWIEYSADVRSDVQPLRDWLWLELTVDGRKDPHHEGVENGVRKMARWELVGRGLPTVFEFRLRAQWASAKDNSTVTLHRFGVAQAVGERVN